MTAICDKEKEKTVRETLGKYFYDLSKLVFTVMVLGNMTAIFGITEFDYKVAIAFFVGTLATWVLATTGNEILKRK